MLTAEQSHELAQGIGASECGAVLGIDPYTTPYQLWLRKTGRLVEDISDKPAIIMGNLLEPVIAKRYSQMTGEKVARANKAFKHPKYPHIICHLDRKVVGKSKVVEIKTANPFSNAWGEAGTDEVPQHYIAQVQHQLAVTGFDEADLIVFRGTTDLRIYNFKRDQEVIDLIIEKVNQFWNVHILQDIAPPATTRGDLKIIYPVNNGNFIEVTDTAKIILQNLNHFKSQIKIIEEKKELCEKDIIEFIADHDGIMESDKILATFQANKNGTRVLRIK